MSVGVDMGELNIFKYSYILYIIYIYNIIYYTYTSYIYIFKVIGITPLTDMYYDFPYGAPMLIGIDYLY